MDDGWQWWLGGRYRSPENRKSENIKGKIEIKGDLIVQWRWYGYQRKEENKGFPMSQQSREMVKEWVRYGRKKKWKLRKLTES
jgi:hypothetical protein